MSVEFFKCHYIIIVYSQIIEFVTVPDRYMYFYKITYYINITYYKHYILYVKKE